MRMEEKFVTFSWILSFIVFSRLFARFTLRNLTKGLMVMPYKSKNRIDYIFWDFLATRPRDRVSDYHVPGKRR